MFAYLDILLRKWSQWVNYPKKCAQLRILDSLRWDSCECKTVESSERGELCFVFQFIIIVALKISKFRRSKTRLSFSFPLIVRTSTSSSYQCYASTRLDGNHNEKLWERKTNLSQLSSQLGAILVSTSIYNIRNTILAKKKYFFTTLTI